MIERFLNDRVVQYCGDAYKVLRTLPSDFFDCVVTSPPYWGLRDFHIEGQLGLESSLGEHIAAMVAVFDQVRRVLKPSGTLWLNYGDCYASTPNGRSAADTKAAGNDDRTFRDKPISTVGPIYPPDMEWRGLPLGRIHAGAVLKPKDLCMVPNRLAIALQEDGWWVRSEIVWGKPNPMPDSRGKYRPSIAHEKVFLLAKSGKHYYDAESVALPCISTAVAGAPAETRYLRNYEEAPSRRGRSSRCRSRGLISRPFRPNLSSAASRPAVRRTERFSILSAVLARPR